MIKLCSWNIQAGGGSRVLPIIKAIAKSKSNIVALSEFRNNDSGNLLRNYLLRYGYRYQAVTHSSRNDNSVLVASLLPFNSEIYPSSDPQYSGNIIAAHFSAFSVLGVYLPHKKKHQLLEFITKLSSDHTSPFIICGDYNTGVNYVDQKGKSFWYTDQLSKLKKSGQKDAFRLVNGEVEEYSWYSHEKNGYRYDHTFVDESLVPIVTNCYYNHQWRIDKLSDHSPMFLELG